MVLALLPMKTPYYEGGRSTQPPVSAGRPEGRHDVRLAGASGALFNLIVLGLIPNVLMQPFMFLLPVYTDEILQQGAEIGGSLLAVNGLGGLLAAFIIASFGFIFRKGYIVLAMAVVGSLLIILMAQVSWLIPSIILVACFGFSQSGFRTTNGNPDSGTSPRLPAVPHHQPPLLRPGIRRRRQSGRRVGGRRHLGQHGHHRHGQRRTAGNTWSASP